METSDRWSRKNSVSMNFFRNILHGSRTLKAFTWPADRDGSVDTLSDPFEGAYEPMRSPHQHSSFFQEPKKFLQHTSPLRQETWRIEPASLLSSFAWSPFPSVEGLERNPQMQALDEGDKGKVRQDDFWLQRNSSTWQESPSPLSTSYSNSDPLESHSTLAIPSHPSSSLLTPLSGPYAPLPFTLSSKDSAFYTPLVPLSTHLPLGPIFLSTPDPIGSSDHFLSTSASPPAGTTHPSPTALEDLASTNDSNWWGLLAILVVLLTAMGNILVILAISWERRLQNMTNYFLLSLAVTDFMVATLVMPLAIVVLVLGHFPFSSELCLVWISLDVLFCTASIMHLCTISVDRFLSLRYPMKFGRHKTRRRVVLKIVLVWCLSLAMSLPLSLMYAPHTQSTIVDGVCQIPVSLFQIIGSVICFYIPLVIMLVTYALTVRLLSKKKMKLTMAATTTIVEPYPDGGAPKPSRWKSLLCKTSSNFSNTTATSAVDTDLADVALEGCRYSSEEGESVFSSPMYNKRSAYHVRYGSSTTTTTSSSYRGGLPRNAMGIGRSLSPHSPKRSPYSIKELEAEVGRLAVELDEVEGSFYPPVTSSSAMELTVFPPQSSPERLRSANSSNASSPRRSKTSEGNGEDLHQNSSRSVSPKHGQVAYDTTGHLDIKRENHNHDHLHEEATAQQRHLHPNRNAGGGGEGGGNCHVAVPCSCAPKFFLEGMGTEPANSSPSSSQCVECVDCLDSHSNRPSHLNTSSTTKKKKKKKNFLHAKASTKTSSSSSSSSSSCLPSMLSCLRSGRRTNNHLPKVTTEASCHDSSLHCPPQTNPDVSPIGSFASSSGAPLPAAVPGGPLRRSNSPHRLHRSATESRGRWADDSSRPVDLIARANTRTGTTMPSIVRRGSKDSSIRNHSRSSSFKYVFSKRHGRNIRMEQKATKVLGIVFFTFVILWAPFFIINVINGVCPSCGIGDDVINLVTWLGYASSTVNPFFYTFFNNTFRQTFLKIIQCKMNRTRKYHY